jgi:hypothetical protein
MYLETNEDLRLTITKLGASEQSGPEIDETLEACGELAQRFPALPTKGSSVSLK